MKEHPEQKLLAPMLKLFYVFIIKFYYKVNETMKCFGIKCINIKEIFGCEMRNQISS